MIYEKILKESKRLETKINELQKQLDTFPEGKLISTANTKGTKWYRSDGHKSVYLPKKERQLAEQLAHKKYLSLQLQNLLHEKNAIDFYLRHHDSNAYQTEQSFVNSLQYKDLLSPIFTPLSEELIDMFLHKNNIPFRYECSLQLDEITLFPDFTIRHPETGDVYYWEHFGMMDNPAYAKNVLSKLQFYISNGIIPSIQLITTYETKENPLVPETVEKIVEHYFL